MFKTTAFGGVLTVIFVAALFIFTSALQTHIDGLTDQLARQSETLEQLSIRLKRFETCANLVGAQSARSAARKKSATEVQPPRGPMPTSILAESERQPADPPPGTDVTSDLTQQRIKMHPCVKPCNALRVCSMKGQCAGLDTRSEDEVTDVCFSACRVNASLREALMTQTDCSTYLTMARTRISGFAALCPAASQ
ncbi:MAG: hypothetical protein VX589_05300 [Myxococcota bacterium]|nr:hypothetical protein [Myxococcota bacterium]